MGDGRGVAARVGGCGRSERRAGGDRSRVARIGERGDVRSSNGSAGTGAVSGGGGGGRARAIRGASATGLYRPAVLREHEPRLGAVGVRVGATISRPGAAVLLRLCAFEWSVAPRERRERRCGDGAV